MKRLNDFLAATFPGVSLVVKDQVIGYRRKKDLFVLMVEAFGEDDSDQSGPYVVKIGPEETIRKGDPGMELLPPGGPQARPGLPWTPPRRNAESGWPDVDEPGVWRCACSSLV